MACSISIYLLFSFFIHNTYTYVYKILSLFYLISYSYYEWVTLMYALKTICTNINVCTAYRHIVLLNVLCFSTKYSFIDTDVWTFSCNKSTFLNLLWLQLLSNCRASSNRIFMLVKSECSGHSADLSKYMKILSIFNR